MELDIYYGSGSAYLLGAMNPVVHVEGSGHLQASAWLSVIVLLSLCLSMRLSTCIVICLRNRNSVLWIRIQEAA